MKKPMMLVILPQEDVARLELIKNTNWEYMSKITLVKKESDIDEELKEIKRFYGEKTLWSENA